MNVWLKLSEKDLQLSAVVVVTLFFQGKRSRRDLKFFTREIKERDQGNSLPIVNDELTTLYVCLNDVHLGEMWGAFGNP